MSPTEEITAALALFSSQTRLYSLCVDNDDSDELLVEAFASHDAVQQIGAHDVIAVSTNAHIKLEPLMGKPAELRITLADGTRASFVGDISEAAMLGSNGSLTRYRVRLSPWMWRLSQSFNCRVWENKSIIEIVEAVFQPYMPLARWRWSDEVVPFMADAPLRSYCCQYRESDLAFIERLLTEEGLAWRFEQCADGPGAVIFADSSQACAVPDDACSAADGGIRFHAARSGERQDTVQALVSQRSLGSSLSSVLSYDYKSKKIVSSSSPSRLPLSARLPALESFDVPGQYAFSNAAHARRHADMQMEGREARSQLWCGRSTVRTLRAGTRLAVTGAPLQALADAPPFAILSVTGVGINNLPLKTQEALAELFGPIPELLEDVWRARTPDDFALALAQARVTGYANCFEAVLASVTWRPMLKGSDGRSHPRPTARGSQTSIVVGADGGDQPNGADELYCDRLGRVRIRFHWQDDGNASCWVRVAQRSAGGGMGSQFLPRIGQEVLVQFLEGDIDRPIIVGALYNGQGEGGIAPTPGGRDGRDSDDSLFGMARDHARSAQGNVAGGNSPLWHGASGAAAGHRNGAAQWGLRSKEFGGSGYNQLLFDDTDAQGRVQLKSSQAASELNLGHLVHAADNYRGSFRGMGAELRTDAYGAVRAGAGLLISSYRIRHNAGSREPMGDNVAGIALMKQAVKVGETFSGAAVTHKTVSLASHVGGAKANGSLLDEEAAPLKAMLAAVSGVAGDGKLPHTSDAIIAIAAKGGLGVNAGQSVQLANGETVTLMSGQDSQFVTGGEMHVHSRQAIGVLGGALKAGEGNAGLQMIAAKDAIDIQSQGDGLQVQARDQVDVISANAHIDWAAAKRISLSTAGGANITIEGGNITVQCPGKLVVNAGKKGFVGPDHLTYPLPSLPRAPLPNVHAKFDLRITDMPGPSGIPIPYMNWEIVRATSVKNAYTSEAVIVKGETDLNGKLVMSGDDEAALKREYDRTPDRLWLVYGGQALEFILTSAKASWTEQQKWVHALDAMGYSDQMWKVNGDPISASHERFVRREVEANSGSSLFRKLGGKI